MIPSPNTEYIMTFSILSGGKIFYWGNDTWVGSGGYVHSTVLYLFMSCVLCSFCVLQISPELAEDHTLMNPTVPHHLQKKKQRRNSDTHKYHRQDKGQHPLNKDPSTRIRWLVAMAMVPNTPSPHPTGHHSIVGIFEGIRSVKIVLMTMH